MTGEELYMAKDHPTGKSGLYAAFLELETPEECYRFLQDVCSYAELSAMEQRYNIGDHQPCEPGAESGRQRPAPHSGEKRRLY